MKPLPPADARDVAGQPDGDLYAERPAGDQRDGVLGTSHRKAQAAHQLQLGVGPHDGGACELGAGELLLDAGEDLGAALSHVHADESARSVEDPAAVSTVEPGSARGHDVEVRQGPG